MATSNNTASKLITEKDTFISYYYKVTEFYIITNGIPDPLPVERIVGMRIEHDFEVALFPLFKVSVVLERSRYFNLIKNKANVEFKLRLQKFYKKKDSNDENSIPTDCINDVFIMYNDENNPDMERDLLTTEGKKKTDVNELDALNNIVDLFLFLKKTTCFRKKFNAVYINNNLATAITRMLSINGASKVLMSPIENGRSYSQIILPPQSIGKQLMYLSNVYGLHQKGTMIYFGLFHSYILNRVGAATAYLPSEYKDTVIFVLAHQNTMNGLSGAIIKPKEKINYYIANSSAVEVLDRSQSENALGGARTTVIGLNGGGGAGGGAGNPVVGGLNSKIVFNKTANPFMASALSATQYGDGHTISLALDNVNIENFNPNKQFSIIFEDPTLNALYKGKYHPSSIHYIFNKDGDSASVSALMVMKQAQ